MVEMLSGTFGMEDSFAAIVRRDRWLGLGASPGAMSLLW